MIKAVVFDLDGVLLVSERIWDEARRIVAERNGGNWQAGATAAMQGMSSREWAAYLHDELSLDLPTDDLVDLVVREVLASYTQDLPIVPDADELLQRLHRRSRSRSPPPRTVS